MFLAPEPGGVCGMDLSRGRLEGRHRSPFLPPFGNRVAASARDLPQSQGVVAGVREALCFACRSDRLHRPSAQGVVWVVFRWIHGFPQLLPQFMWDCVGSQRLLLDHDYPNEAESIGYCGSCWT